MKDDEYQKRVIPVVVKLFSSTDRGTRMQLLVQVINDLVDASLSVNLLFTFEMVFACLDEVLY